MDVPHPATPGPVLKARRVERPQRVERGDSGGARAWKGETRQRTVLPPPNARRVDTGARVAPLPPKHFPVVWQTSEQTRAFHGRILLRKRTGLLASPTGEAS